MIDLTCEELIRLADVPGLRRLPRRRAGKRLHIATVHRWASVGCQGVKLETLRVGGALCTSEAALQRFFDQLTSTDDNPPPAGRTPARRSHEIARCEADLTAAGI